MRTSKLPSTTIPRRHKVPMLPIPVAADAQCCPHCGHLLATHRTAKGEIVGKSCLRCGAAWGDEPETKEVNA